MFNHAFVKCFTKALMKRLRQLQTRFKERTEGKLTNAANPESVGARPRAGASLVGTLGTEKNSEYAQLI